MLDHLSMFDHVSSPLQQERREALTSISPEQQPFLSYDDSNSVTSSEDSSPTSSPLPSPLTTPVSYHFPANVQDRPTLKSTVSPFVLPGIFESYAVRFWSLMHTAGSITRPPPPNRNFLVVNRGEYVERSGAYGVDSSIAVPEEKRDAWDPNLWYNILSEVGAGDDFQRDVGRPNAMFTSVEEEWAIHIYIYLYGGGHATLQVGSVGLEGKPIRVHVSRSNYRATCDLTIAATGPVHVSLPDDFQGVVEVDSPGSINSSFPIIPFSSLSTATRSPSFSPELNDLQLPVGRDRMQILQRKRLNAGMVPLAPGTGLATDILIENDTDRVMRIERTWVVIYREQYMDERDADNELDGKGLHGARLSGSEAVASCIIS
ncbi:hypothetical protein P7C70_g6838, partial [Phenoliferia sp. Uapishka_3]